jgi:S-adenosyl methyltransferase
MANGTDKPAFDVSVPSPARVWNYWVGGKDNYESDRAAAAQILAHVPTLPVGARLARKFLIGAVEYLITGYGVRQFLDIGSGLPTADNTHEVAQRAAPSSRIVYVDNDPVVISHANALLASTPEGRCDFIHGDLRDVDEILAAAARTLDFTLPVAVIMLQVLHFIPDSDDPAGIIARIMDRLPSGSFLVISQAPADMDPNGRRVTEQIARRSGVAMRPRSQEEVARFFDGLEILGPGVVSGLEWLELWSAADGVDRIGVIPDGVTFGLNGIARKP